MTTLIKYVLVLLSLCCSFFLRAQSYTGTVKDATTKTPIAFATIQYGEYSGIITNEDGVFTLQEEELLKVKDSVRITSMGYAEKGIWVATQRDSIIYLKPKAFELKGVFLSSNPLSVEAIIDSVNANVTKNYAVSTLSRKRVFIRQSILSDMNKVDFEFKKSTIEEFNEKFLDSVVDLVPRNSEYYQEMAGDIYGNYSENKLVVDKGARLFDKSKDISMEGIEETIDRVFKEKVKPDSYFKIKSGFFSTKIQVDSILKANEDADKVAEEVDPKEDKWTFTKQMKRQVASIYKELLFNEDSKLDMLRKSNRYEFTQDNYTYINDEPVYIIHFEPKGKKDFRGTLYVNTEDFAIVRADFNNVRPLFKVGLLGVRYGENVYRGTMLFEKGEAGVYSPKYVTLERGSYFGVDRPLKIIEKNKHVKGRRKQNELSFEIDVAGTQIDKYELVVFNNATISQATYDSTLENENAKATYLPKYDPDFWKGYTIMEPNAAIQAFEVVE